MRSEIAILFLRIAASLTYPSEAAPSTGTGEFRLLLLHTNDMHSRFVQTNKYSSTCSDELAAQNKCYGGFARLKEAINEARAEAVKSGIASIFLNAGDTFQGTHFYSLKKWHIVADLIGTLGIDVMSLGNHEFDDGIRDLSDYLKNITIPVVAANLDLSNAPELNLPILTPSTVLNISGKKIGIVGYLTPETKSISSPGNLGILDEIPNIQREAKQLKENGADIIIALGHSGFETDLKIAKEVPEVSIVVGGHTNTFLYTRKNSNESFPDIENAVSTYPHMVTQESGRRVAVVQAYAYTKYMGKLWLTFNNRGDIITADGNPVLLDSSIKEDENVLRRVLKWTSDINANINRVEGMSNVFLEGAERFCGVRECNLGNFIADAFVDYITNKYQGTNTSWTDAPIALIQSGCIRTNNGIGKVRLSDVLVIMPFQNELKKVKLSGRTIRKAFEHAVHRYTDPSLGGEFLQVSGIKVAYDLSKEPGERVVSVSIRCGNCSVPNYRPLEDENIYTVAMSEYLERGGDDFNMFPNEIIQSYFVGVTDTDAVSVYLKKMSVVYPGLEGRITFFSGKTGASSTIKSASISTTLIAIYYLCKYVIV